MKIDAYEFGVMTIEGNEYKDDVIVFGDHIREKWWRRVGHRLEPEDLDEALQDHPEVLVVGQGASAMLKVADLTRRILDEHGVQLMADRTEDAWRTYNRLEQEGRRVVGAFHLTC